MRSVFLSAAVLLFASSCLMVDCGGGTGFIITPAGELVEFDHSVGTTSCPQDIGSLSIKKAFGGKTAETVAWSFEPADLGGTPASLVEGQVAGGTAGADGEAAIAGDGVMLDLWFNCGQPQAFQTTGTITVKDDKGATLEEKTITVKGNVQ